MANYVVEVHVCQWYASIHSAWPKWDISSCIQWVMWSWNKELKRLLELWVFTWAGKGEFAEESSVKGKDVRNMNEGWPTGEKNVLSWVVLCFGAKQGRTSWELRWLILPCLSSSVLPVMLSGQWAEAIVTTLANIWWTQSHQNHLPNAWLSHRASNAWQLWKSCCSHSNCFVLINSGSCYCDSPLCSMAQRRHGTAKCSSAGRHIVESMAAEEGWERRVEVEAPELHLGPRQHRHTQKTPQKASHFQWGRCMSLVMFECPCSRRSSGKASCRKENVLEASGGHFWKRFK